MFLLQLKFFEQELRKYQDKRSVETNAEEPTDKPSNAQKTEANGVVGTEDIKAQPVTGLVEEHHHNHHENGEKHEPKAEEQTTKVEEKKPEENVEKTEQGDSTVNTEVKQDEEIVQA